MDDYIPDFILNLDKNQKNEYTTDTDIPDFIQNLKTSEHREFNYLDEEVKTNLWVDLDNSWSSNKEEVKKYVDSLSTEDYKTWLDWKNQGYSLDARKALMDQKDLLNPSEKWDLKYKINTPEPENWVYKYIQNLNEGYEESHPWSQSAEDWLSNASQWLENKLGKTNLVNKYIDKYDPYSNLSPEQAEQQLNTVWVLANMVRIPKTLAQMVLNTSERAVRVFDNIQNIKAAGLAEWANLVQRLQWKEPVFDIQYWEERSNPIGSYIQTVADWLGIGFVTAYPVATYFFSLLGSYDEKIAELEDIVFSEKPEQAAEWLLNQQLSKDLIEIAWLNATDQESLKEAIADGIVLTVAAVLHMWWKKLSSSDIVRLHKEAVTKADRFARNYAKEQMKPNYEMREAASNLPEWTEVLDEQGKPIAVSTSEWSSFTPGWAIDTWVKWIKGYAKQFKEYMQRFYNNYKNWVTLRNPEAPVWELPIAKPVKTSQPKETTETTEITEERPWEVQWEVVEETPNEIKNTWAKKIVKPLEPTEATSIWEYLRKISNQITWKKWWMDEALFEKFSTSPDLQTEYINTIEPYIKANWAENPGWVIWWQLESFIEAAKDQLLARRLQNQQIRKNNRQYKIEVPAEQTAKLDLQDQQIKQLTKILSKSYTDPEKFLMYLLNLPERKIETFNELIPDFTKNLSYIKDTLDITKAITSSDLLWKFLQFKSTRWTRNRHYIRKYLYKKLNEAYKRAWVKYNMRVIENMLNQMSEQDLIELEEIINAESDPAVMNSFIWQIDNASKFEKRKKRIGTEQENIIPETAIFNELTEQWYRPEFEYDKFESDKQKTDLKSILDTKYSNWTTARERIDFYNIWLEPLNPWLLPWSTAAQSLENGVIQFRNNLESFNAWVLWHEIWHQLRWRLTTKELFDFYNNIVKSTKFLKKYEWEGLEDMKKISEYMWLEKTRTWIEEYIGDSFGQILRKGDLYELDDFLPPDIFSLDLSKKVQTIFSEIAKDLWDNLSAFEIWNGEYSTQVKELKKMLDKVKPSKENIEMSKRRNYQWSPMSKTARGGIKRWTDFHRLWLLQDVNPELSNLKFNLDLKSDRLWDLVFEMKDWRQLNWDEFKNTLTEEQMKKLEQDPVLSSNEREEAIKKGEESVQASMKNPNPLYKKYQKEIRDIDPDIVWLVERDWEIYVQYLTESFRERYEMADRPGMVEMHVVKAKDYFTEEELNKLPKDLVSKIKKDAN